MSALTQRWNWQDWGVYLREDGRWAGGLEIVTYKLVFPVNGN